MEQTKRYFPFEVARFGSDRVEMEMRVDPRVEDMLVPPFLLQPLVENAVRHAMPSEGKLTIEVTGEVVGDDVIVRVCDNGVGMTEEARCNILHPESSSGLGIAVKNVHDRICGYFGPGTHMDVDSELGRGTCVILVLKEGLCAVPVRKALLDGKTTHRRKTAPTRRRFHVQMVPPGEFEPPAPARRRCSVPDYEAAFVIASINRVCVRRTPLRNAENPMRLPAHRLQVASSSCRPSVLGRIRGGGVTAWKVTLMLMLLLMFGSVYVPPDFDQSSRPLTEATS